MLCDSSIDGQILSRTADIVDDTNKACLAVFHGSKIAKWILVFGRKP
jgi:hypothetical protein